LRKYIMNLNFLGGISKARTVGRSTLEKQI
jgi:hypothetical protein